MLVLVAIAGMHLGFRALQPEPRVWGDELHYWAFATHEASEGRTSLLPGTLGFDHRPQLATRVFALFADDQGIPTQPREARVSAAKLLQRVSALHICLFCLALAAVYATARTLGLAPPACFASLLFLGFLPQIGFHVHSLWPETLHLWLSSAALLGLVWHLRTGSLYALPPAALAFGFALLAKGSLLPVLVVVVPLLFFEGLRRHGGLPRGPRLGRAILASALFVLPLSAVLVPQLVENRRAGHGAVLAANRWWNLELGLTLGAEDLRGEGEERFRALAETSMRYFQAAEEPHEREALARERTLDYLQEHPGAVLSDQLVQSLQVIGAPSSYAQSLSFRQRWGARPPGWMGAVGRLEWLWSPLVLLAVVGAGVAVATRRGDPCWRLLLGFSAAYAAGLYLVPFKFRFLLPLVPVLALFAGLALTRLAELLAARRAHP